MYTKLQNTSEAIIAKKERRTNVGRRKRYRKKSRKTKLKNVERKKQKNLECGQNYNALRTNTICMGIVK